jgi:hypothetical protein
MKKIAVIMFVVSAALAGCHKSKPAAAKPAGGDMGSAAGSAAGSGDAGSAAGSAAAPAAGGGQ